MRIRNTSVVLAVMLLAGIATIMILRSHFFTHFSQHSLAVRSAKIGERPKRMRTVYYNTRFGLPYVSAALVDSKAQLCVLDKRVRFTETLIVSGVDIDSDCQNVLSQAASLRELILFDCQVTTRAIQVINELTRLESLCCLSDLGSQETFRALANNRVETLEVSLYGDVQRNSFLPPVTARTIRITSGRIDIDLMKRLAEAENLKELSVISFDFENADLSVLCSSKSLQSVVLHGPRINKKTIESCLGRISVHDAVYRPERVR